MCQFRKEELCLALNSETGIAETVADLAQMTLHFDHLVQDQVAQSDERVLAHQFRVVVQAAHNMQGWREMVHSLGARV